MSIAELYDGPDYKDQKFNVAAMTIILHRKNAHEWQQADLCDSAVVHERIKNESHYLLYAKGKEIVCNVDGSKCSSFLLVLRSEKIIYYIIYFLINTFCSFRKYLVLYSDCSPAQGKQIQRVLQRMFQRRESTEPGDTFRLDPVRQSFRKFLGDVAYGKLINPKIPRQTGYVILIVTFLCVNFKHRPLRTRFECQG
jgi:hypothetical protein